MPKTLLLILFAFSALAVFQTYIFYPFLMRFLSFCCKKKHSTIALNNFPTIAILMAAYNEEAVIEEKLNSIFTTDYPLDKIQVYIGSDNSSDATNLIVSKFQKQFKGLHLFAYEERQGKIKIMNALANEAQADWLVFTDANVFFTPSTLPELVKWQNNSEIAMICGHIQKLKNGQKGASEAEVLYMNTENDLKINETQVFGFCLGAEGGCFAIRKAFFEPVPASFSVDDFYTTLSVIQQKGKMVYANKAICYEDTTGSTSIEFKRKARIQKGNLQNLLHFKNLVWNPFSSVAFALWSHKILRWFTPFLLIINAISSFALSCYFELAWIFAIPTILFFAFPLIFKLLRLLGIKMGIITAFNHFVMMNYALMKGFYDFLFGPKTSIWERTQRKI